MRFALRDATGREAPLPEGQRARKDEALLDLSDVAPGLCVLRAHGATGSATARLLVEHWAPTSIRCLAASNSGHAHLGHEALVTETSGAPTAPNKAIGDHSLMIRAVDCASP